MMPRPEVRRAEPQVGVNSLMVRNIRKQFPDFSEVTIAQVLEDSDRSAFLARERLEEMRKQRKQGDGGNLFHTGDGHQASLHRDMQPSPNEHVPRAWSPNIDPPYDSSCGQPPRRYAQRRPDGTSMRGNLDPLPDDNRIRVHEAASGGRRHRLAPSMPCAAGQVPLVPVDFSSLVVDRFRRVVVQRAGCGGILSFSMILRSIFHGGQLQVSWRDLQQALFKMGLQMSTADCKVLLLALDQGGKESTSLDEFLSSIRGHTGARRQTTINMVFDTLDRTGSGAIAIEDLEGVYCAMHDLDVQSGRFTEKQALHNLLKNFDCCSTYDGVVTRDDFMGYYSYISAAIDDEDKFERMLEHVWRLRSRRRDADQTASALLEVTFADGERREVSVRSERGLDLRNSSAVLETLREQGIHNVVEYSWAAPRD